MRKRLLMALFCAAMMLPAAAQWNPGDNNQTKISQQSNIEYDSPAMIRKADGSTILVYRTFGFQTNPETGEKSTERQYYLYLQILDKDGNKKFDGNGKLISCKPTDIAMYSSSLVDTLSNGNLIITFADIRPVDNDNYKDVNGGENHTNIRPCKAIAYCYDQEGNSVWSPDGVMMPYHVMAPNAWVTFYVGEKIAISDDKIYFASVIMEQIVVEEVDKYTHYFEVACLDKDGNILAEKHDSVCQAFNYTIAAAPEGNAYFIYIDENDHYRAQLLGPDLENVWSDTVLVDNTSVVSREASSVVSLPPSDIIPISDGSIGLVYKAFMPHHFSQRYYNRLYPDGRVLDEHVLLSDTAGYDHAYQILVEDDETLTLFQCVEYERTDYGEFFYHLNRIKLDGTRLLPKEEGYWLSHMFGKDLEPLCIVHGDENYNVIVFEKDYYNGAYQNYCYTISPEGKLIQRKPVLNSVYIADFVSASEDQYAYLIFGRDPRGEHGLWISCIDGTDYTKSEELTGELPAKFSIGADKQVVFSEGALMYMPARQTYLFSNRQLHAQSALNRWITETSLEFQDLFGWGSGDHGSKVSTDDADYPVFNEWGDNAILGSTHEPGTWRTMTKDEWDYLLNGRENAAQKRTIGQIHMQQNGNIRGLFLLPDEFEMPSGIEMDMDAQEWEVNTYGPDTLFRLEKAGAVFLPAGGWREDITVNDKNNATGRGLNCYYWMATENGATEAQMMYCSTTGPEFKARPRHEGMMVRLVKDVDSEQGIEDVLFDDKQNRTRKILMDGQLYIIRDGKIYNAQGVEVK